MEGCQFRKTTCINSISSHQSRHCYIRKLSFSPPVVTPVVAPPHPIDLSLPITSTYLRRMRAFGAIQAEYQAAAAAAAAAVAADRRSRWSGTDYEPSVSEALVPTFKKKLYL